jgi:hypothetical protein
MAKNLSAPTRAVWLVALILGVTGILMHVRAVNLKLGVEDFWLVATGLVLLLVANLFRGL